MKGRSLFVGIIICLQVMCIGLQIHKQTGQIARAYETQRAEQERMRLKARRNELMQLVCGLTNYRTVKNYAQEDLGMKPIKISQIRKLVIDDYPA